MAVMQELYNPYNFINDFYRKMNEYWHTYGQKYPKMYQKMLQHELLTAFQEDVISDLFMEIYSHCNVTSDFMEDPYKYYADFLLNYFDDLGNKQILEVGAGAYPTLTEKIADYIVKTNSTGSITGIDPNLITTDIPNATLEKKVLEDISLTNYNLLIGQSPCEATEEIILKSCKEQKEMSILLCGCTHMGTYVSYDTWVEYLCFLIKKHKSPDFKFEELYLPESSGVPYPILTLKKQ